MNRCYEILGIQIVKANSISSYRVMHVYTTIFLLEKATFALLAWHNAQTNSTI